MPRAEPASRCRGPGPASGRIDTDEGRATSAAFAFSAHAAGQPEDFTMGTLKERITEDMKVAMRASDKDRLGLIRMLQAAIKQREVDERIQLDDAQTLSVIEKMIKQRKESIAQFQAGGREDLVAKENAEIVVLQAYLPAQLSEAELDAIVKDAIASTGAASVKDMGKVMAIVKQKASGRADMGAVGARIKAALGG
jgi:uncharacterized protein YqeY